jgi:hypothetical protein
VCVATNPDLVVLGQPSLITVTASVPPLLHARGTPCDTPERTRRYPATARRGHVVYEYSQVRAAAGGAEVGKIDITRLRLHRGDDQDTLDLIRELMDLNVTLVLIGVDIPRSGLLRGAYVDQRTSQWVFPDVKLLIEHGDRLATDIDSRSCPGNAKI